MEIVNVLDTQEGQSIIEAQTQHIANEINGMIMADIMRECYYQGCFRNGMLSEWKTILQVPPLEAQGGALQREALCRE
jgi:hypothetical protein